MLAVAFRLGALLVAGALTAQVAPPLLTDDGTSLPFAVTTPPPAWIEPGLRLTFEVLTGTNPSGDHDYEVDEHGQWVDAGGNRYKRSESVGTGSAGYLQVNVLALDQKQVRAQMLFYLFDGLDSSAPTENTEFGNVSNAGCGGDLWLHPEALRQLLQNGATGLVVRPIDYTIDQVTYKAVLLFWRRAGGRAIWIFDFDSGVLLYASDIQKGGARRAQTGEQLSAGGAMVRFITFKGSRTVAAPWRQLPLPPAVRAARGFDYRGRITVRPVAVDTPLPFQLRYDVTQRGDDWLTANAVTANTLGANELRVRSSHQLTGLWIPPAACAGLKQGQVLDQDLFVKTTVDVTYVDDQVVTISQRSPRQDFQFTYRKSDGLLARGCFTELLAPVIGGPAMSKVVEMELADVR
jgi:hypothetical protein